MFRFVTSFIRHPVATGAIAPSSQSLADAMVSWIDWQEVSTCVEFGPGTGAFTGTLLQSMGEGTRFFTVEVNEGFAATMGQRFPHVETVCRSVEEIDQICDERGVEVMDCVICGLPWAAFPADLQGRLMQALLSRLSPSGYFCTFAYLQGTLLPAGIRFKKLLHRSFSSVQRSPTVWRNLPPAFVYRCRP